LIVERTEHPTWLSNAYLIGDEPGGHGVLVDSNGINQPLIEAVESYQLTITEVLITHSHSDHVVTCAEDADRFGVEVLAHPLVRNAGVRVDQTLEDGDTLTVGKLEIEVIATPGHCPDHLAFLVNGNHCLTADCLFKGTVGGTMGGGETGYSDQVHSIMERLMKLPPETQLHPGHKEPTTVAKEWDENPFIRMWRGLDPEGNEPCRVRGEDATLVLWGPDYDGTHKAWVRFADGRDAIVGGSQVER
jgi:glyoxylase-like metal-dependent hydrolase (beta-lactamase superfamily II)